MKPKRQSLKSKLLNDTEVDINSDNSIYSKDPVKELNSSNTLTISSNENIINTYPSLICLIKYDEIENKPIPTIWDISTTKTKTALVEELIKINSQND